MVLAHEIIHREALLNVRLIDRNSDKLLKMNSRVQARRVHILTRSLFHFVRVYPFHVEGLIMKVS